MVIEDQLFSERKFWTIWCDFRKYCTYIKLSGSKMRIPIILIYSVLHFLST